VTGEWYTEDSYRYYELSVDDSDTYRVHTWELYEPTLATNHQHAASGITYDNTDSGLTGDDVQEAIDELAGMVGGSLGWFNVEDYGAVHDGSTDDTVAIQDTIDAAEAAGGGVVYFPKGVYSIEGALQDGSRGNAQLLLPSKDYVDDEQLSIVLLGEVPPPTTFSVIGDTPNPDGHSILLGTLTSVSGTSPSLLGGWGPDSALDFTNINVRIENLAFRLPENPVYSALDLSKVAGVDLDNVLCDVTEYYIQGLTEPTTAASYGIRLPELNNGALTRLGVVNVAGYYNGIQIGEHTLGQDVSAWGCKVAFQTIAGYHASHFSRLMAVHCERVLQGSGGIAYLSISQLNIEHAASGWWITDEDIDDPSNYLYGWAHWKVTLAGVGHDSTFTIDGATNFHTLEMGDDPFGATLDYGEDVDISDLAFDDVADSGVSDEVARADHVHGMPSEPAGGHGPILLESGHAVPFTFDEILQESDGSDFLYASA
jgi:hypothetical protein